VNLTPRLKAALRREQLFCAIFRAISRLEQSRSGR
jgi:hypothetical protein